MSRLEETFPGLRSSEFRVTSPETPDYNCLAWAAGNSEDWWEPDLDEFYVWPAGVRREYTLDAHIEAFAVVGYEPCGSHAPEPNCEKVAIFVDSSGEPTHAARQLPNGRWTSKIGAWEDIEHDLRALEGAYYGSVAAILKRPSTGGEHAPEAV